MSHLFQALSLSHDNQNQYSKILKVRVNPAQIRHGLYLRLSHAFLQEVYKYLSLYTEPNTIVFNTHFMYLYVHCTVKMREIVEHKLVSGDISPYNLNC